MNQPTYGGLPNIPTYDPGDTAWEAFNRIGWRVDPGRACLLVHDMQGFYVDSLPSKTAEGLVDNISRLEKMCREHGLPVIYSVAAPCTTREERGLLTDFHGMGMRDVPEHYNVDDRIKPQAGDLVVTKKIYSAFFRTPLEEYLRDRDLSQIIICGLYANIGCQITAFDAFKRGVEVFFAADSMAAYTEEEHIYAAQYVGKLCAAVHSTDNILAQLAVAST